MDPDRLRRFLELLAESDLEEYDAMFGVLHAARISAYGPTKEAWEKLRRGDRVVVIPDLMEREVYGSRSDESIGKKGTLVSKGGYAGGIVFDDDVGKTDDFGRQTKTALHGKRIRPLTEERQ